MAYNNKIKVLNTKYELVSEINTDINSLELFLKDNKIVLKPAELEDFFKKVSAADVQLKYHDNRRSNFIYYIEYDPVYLEFLKEEKNKKEISNCDKSGEITLKKRGRPRKNPIREKIPGRKPGRPKKIIV